MDRDSRNRIVREDRRTPPGVRSSREHIPRMSRRGLLVSAGAGALGLAVSRGAGTLRAAWGAPAVLKGTSLSILQGTYFIAAGQDLYKRQAQEWGATNGVTVTTDFLNWPDLQPKIAAAIQAGGYDIVELWPGWNYLYANSLVDVTDLAKAVEKRGGGFEAYVAHDAQVRGRYLGVPHGQSNAELNYRISLFKEAGAELLDPAVQSQEGKWPDWTWDEFFAFGKKLKAAGHPIGQALGHSPGDPQSFCYPYMWSFGAMEVEKDGKTIAFNKPQFVDGMKRFIQAWKDAYDETGTSWDDSTNNRAFLSGQISATINGSSIYYVGKKDQPAIAQDMNHTLMPRGPAGRFSELGSRTFAILKNSRNIAGAKAFLAWWFADPQYGAWFHVQEGYQLQNTKKWASDPIWLKDPKMSAFRAEPKYGRDQGYAGPPDKQASLAWSKYVVVDTFARAVQSGDAAGAIKWGADQLQRIYGSQSG